MSKILKRPMFRGGGAVNSKGTGIMSGLESRVEMQEGGFLSKIYNALNPSSYEILQRLQQQEQKPYMFEGIFDPVPLEEMTFPSEEVKQQVLEEEKQKQIEQEKTTPQEQKTIQQATDTVAGKGQEPTKSDLKAVYEDLLPLFEKELGPEEDEFRRQKYMQLAKFGLGLLAQPGGSLAEAVGKAGAEPLAGLEAAAAREAQARRAPKALALEAALKEVDPSDVVKKVKALSKLSGMSESEVAKSFVTTGEETRAGTKVDDYLRESANNLGLSGGAGLNYTKQIKAVYDVDPSLAGKFDKLVPEKPTENEYYVTTSGDLVRYKDGQFLIPSDKGFTD